MQNSTFTRQVIDSQCECPEIGDRGSTGAEEAHKFIQPFLIAVVELSCLFDLFVGRLSDNCNKIIARSLIEQK